MRYFLWLILCAVLLTPFSLTLAAGRPLWEQEAMLLYSPSSLEFSRVRQLGNYNSRLVSYTRALDLLHKKGEAQRAQYEQAQGMFSTLVEELDGDAVALASRYYLARIMQSHPMEQDLQTAKGLYFNLFNQHPDRFFGQMAFLKYATIEIYDDSVEGDVTNLKRIQSLEKYVDSITVDSMRRNFHRVMGDGYLSFNLDAASAYRHLNAAYDLGLNVDLIRVDVLINIGELGEQLGEPKRALAAYEELVELAPKHERHEEFVAKVESLAPRL